MFRLAVFSLLVVTTPSVQASAYLHLDCQATLLNITPAVPSASSTVSCPLFDGS